MTTKLIIDQKGYRFAVTELEEGLYHVTRLAGGGIWELPIDGTYWLLPFTFGFSLRFKSRLNGKVIHLSDRITTISEIEM